jgi:hypothetical protein
MKRQVVAPLLTAILAIGVFANINRTATSKAALSIERAGATLNTAMLPAFATTLDVDRTDDTAAATACTASPNDCSLRGAVINANADLGATAIVINLDAGTTYNLTLSNATQENAAATGDLDITTTLHSVTIAGGGSSTVVDASGLTSGNNHDRAFQITGSGVTAIFQDLTIQNGQAADDGSSGASTNPTAQNATRAGGGILNNGGSVTLTNVAIQSCQVLGKGDTVVNDHTGLDAHGGGLASLGTGTVMITGSTFAGNSALGGNGGNFNNGQGSNALGGSIYVEAGTLNIGGSTIENSAATGGQGGSVSQNGMENGGFGGMAQGGGVWVGGATTTINNTTFENTSVNAGASGTGGNGSEPGAEANGGGLYCLGNATVSNSTFHLASAHGGNTGNTFGPSCVGGHTSGDAGAARGGAIFVETNFSVASSSLIIDTSTFANNSAIGGNGGDGGQTDGGLNCGANGAGGLAYGGAITNGGAATLNIKHSTISGNSAQAGNSGVAQSGSTKPLRPVAQGTGGGVRVGSAGTTFEDTIIADNSAANGTGDNSSPPVAAPNVDGTATSNGHNLLGVTTGATGFTGTGDLTGANPMLDSLADNGGPTKTMKLLTGSDAIDAGVASGATFDQRGKPRTYDDPSVPNEATSDGTDIGAFELQPDCILTCPSDVNASNDPGECGAVVTYDDPTGAGCGTVTCDHPSGTFFDVGTTTVTCTSSAGPTCSFTVTVNDDEAPVITTIGSATLWPPNHKYVTFNVSNLVTSVSDNCDSSIGVGDVTITNVTSDEPENTAGDGNTLNDIVIAGNCQSVQLRSERIGNGNGRVYTITVQVTDSNGNTSSATIKVKVPQSQNGSAAIDDGPHYTVVGTCP